MQEVPDSVECSEATSQTQLSSDQWTAMEVLNYKGQMVFGVGVFDQATIGDS